MSPSTNPGGYKIVPLCFNGKVKYFPVHILIARSFVDGYAPGLQVNHIDGDKQNNNASNLEWVTPKENTRHAIEVLGFNQKGEKNHNAKRVYGYDKLSGVLLYEFGSIMDAARYFYKEGGRTARSIAGAICQVASEYDGRRTYKNCVWRYSPLSSSEIKEMFPVRRKTRNAVNRKLSNETVREIKHRLMDPSLSRTEIARQYNISSSTIYNIDNNKIYKDVKV